MDDVKLFNEKRKRRREEIREVKSAEGKKTIGDVIRWMVDEHELQNTYTAPFDNCQHFAARLFAYVVSEA